MCVRICFGHTSVTYQIDYVERIDFYYYSNPNMVTKKEMKQELKKQKQEMQQVKQLMKQQKQETQQMKLRSNRWNVLPSMLNRKSKRCKNKFMKCNYATDVQKIKERKFTYCCDINNTTKKK